MSNFWKELKKPFFILAPMDDVTDVVFRHVIAKAAPADVYFTEFTSTKAFKHKIARDRLAGRLYFSDDEQPMVAHIWGDEPENFAYMAKEIKKMGFSGIDINMGCPAANVAHNGKGSGLIKRPDVAAEIIKAAKEGGLPVSVKTRIGYYNPEEFEEWISHLLRQDIVNLTVHLRTKLEMSSVDAHYELIPRIKELRDEIAPNTLLTINGDILDRQMGLELAEKYDVDGVMIGRGVFKNPFAFEKEKREHSVKEHFDLFHYHINYYEKMIEIEPELRRMLNRLYKTYIHGFRGANRLRDDMVRTKTPQEAREIMINFEKENPDLF